MAAKVYWEYTTLTGGGASALDSKDGANLNNGDKALVHTTGNILYIYQLDADSGAAESSPDVISPDDNPGSKRWVLQHVMVSAITFGATWKIEPSGDDLVFYYYDSGWVEHNRLQKPS